MIIEWLLDAMEAALTWLAGLLPSSTFNPVSILSSTWGVLGDVNYFFPVAELGALVAGFLLLGVGWGGVTLAIWVWAQIRGSSGVG